MFYIHLWPLKILLTAAYSSLKIMLFETCSKTYKSLNYICLNKNKNFVCIVEVYSQ